MVRLVCTWFAVDLQDGSFGLHLVCMGLGFGLHLVCTGPEFGLHLLCAWYALQGGGCPGACMQTKFASWKGTPGFLALSKWQRSAGHRVARDDAEVLVMSTIVDFYREQSPDYLGRTLREIRQWDHGRLEGIHDYI